MTRHDLPLPGLHVLVGDERRWSATGGSPWIAPPTMRRGDLGRPVHVVSRPAGGEVRGYVLDEHGVLHLRVPAYPRDWPEVDQAVADVLGARLARWKPHPDLPHEVVPR